MINRYALLTTQISQENGTWVEYKDYEKEVSELKAYIQSLEDILDRVACAGTKTEACTIVCKATELSPKLCLAKHDADLIRHMIEVGGWNKEVKLDPQVLLDYAASLERLK